MTKNWISVGHVDDIPFLGARVVKTSCEDIAVFKTSNGSIFALIDKCPHKGGPLSQGIVHGNSVSCPLHNWNISLESGKVIGPDQGCTRTIQTEVRKGLIYIELDSESEEREVERCRHVG
ncbi:MAG: nitrite reductase small subunit NirD [Candidatus Dadabacteria bacterium]|nr:nitrite reductase small subunit NirD [Candidatus Dadabacteria bacterium]